MNTKLHEAIAEVCEKFVPDFLHDDNFTVCLIWDDGRIVSHGFAKCNPRYDECDDVLGESIALARATKRLLAAKGGKLVPVKKTRRATKK